MLIALNRTYNSRVLEDVLYLSALTRKRLVKAGYCNPSSWSEHQYHELCR